jgi:hypothetical protein
MPAGRPTSYRPEYCDRVIEFGRQGKSVVQMACALGKSKDSLYEWAKVHPEFSDAFTRARDLAQAWFEGVGQDGLDDPGFNASLWAKQVSCRFRADYTDTTRFEHSGKALPSSVELVAVDTDGRAQPLTRADWKSFFRRSPSRK